MVRFPNPGSEITSFIHIFQTLYSYLGHQPFFSLDDMSQTLTSMHLAASSGYVGEQALQLSTREDRSRDPLYNQSKMYAELFRSLGWISSQEEKALLFSFTFLGAHVAYAKIDPGAIFEESVLGINYPNDVIDIKYEAEIRPLAAILITAHKLDNIICRDEMIIGPMNVNDKDKTIFNDMIAKLKTIRGDLTKLHQEISFLSSQLKIQPNTMKNYTRFPIAVLDYCQWVEKERNNKVYPGSRGMVIMRLTKKGRERVFWLQNALDIRRDYVNSLDENMKESIIRVSFYNMLGRAGFDMEPVMPVLKKDFKVCRELLGKDVDILYSPYQTTKTFVVNSALDYSPEKQIVLGDEDKAKLINNEDDVSNDNSHRSTVRISEGAAERIKSEDVNSARLEIAELLDGCTDVIAVMQHLFQKYSLAKKDVFYPLVGDLFSIIGFNCQVPRSGINYERWDAMLADNYKSIPIEIKSPTEEEYISVKAIRQALENKIVLLSRKTYTTDWETTSLVVGYKLPNNRAEVASLIEAIKKSYGIKIGVIDFYSLLELAVKSISYKMQIIHEDIRAMEGLINVKDFRSEIQ